jgi:hypothetical protein
MDWENERYVRVYTRDTIDWVALGWEAQALFLLLIRKVDRSGVLEIGRHGARGVAGLIGMPSEVVERALAVLTTDGCVTIRDGLLLMPNFIEAQEAKQSDKQRQKESRDKRRKGAMSQTVTEPSQIVTERHGQSHAVTDGHTLSLQPSLASQSNQPEDPPARDPGTTDTAPRSTGTAQRLTGQDLLRLFGKVRGQVFPSCLPWATARDPKGDAGTFASLLGPEEAADVEPSMRLAFGHIRDGRKGWNDPRHASDVSFAFGAWKSGFHGLREEIHGRAPRVAETVNTNQPQKRQANYGR